MSTWIINVRKVLGLVFHRSETDGNACGLEIRMQIGGISVYDTRGEVVFWTNNSHSLTPLGSHSAKR